MKISLKLKFMSGLSVIILLSGIALNLLIRQVFQSSLENSIKTSMADLMKNTREYIRYRIGISGKALDEEGLDAQAVDICQYFLNNYNSETEIRALNGQKVEGSSRLTDSAAEEATTSAQQGKAVINLEQGDKTLAAVLSYPLSFEKKYIGILLLKKDYTDLYKNNTGIVNLLTYIEIGIFGIILVLSFIFTSRIVRPIILLTKGIKRVAEGDYSVKVKLKSRDEIGILAREFMNMEEKINTQITAINDEKDKVLKLEKGRREFFNNVTHELKTPLTAISGYSQMLLDKKLEDKEFSKRAVERIHMESDRLHQLVLDLIAVSKGLSSIDEDKIKIDMKALLEEICSDMGIKANKYSISINTAIEAGFIVGQANRIRQLIINVVDNAIKYSFHGEVIYLKAFNEKAFYVVEVINKGERIPEEIYKKIFEPFIKSKHTREAGSSGLGLYICSEIIREHNGEITIENGEIIKVKIKIPSLGNNLETSL